MKALPAIYYHEVEPSGFTSGYSFDELLENLNDIDINKRKNAARILGDWDAKRPIEALIAALQDSDTDVRSYAAHSLCKLKAVGIIEPLLAALYNPDGSLNWWAAVALGKLDHPAGGNCADSLNAKRP